jgi:hypothetical protein
MMYAAEARKMEANGTVRVVGFVRPLGSATIFLYFAVMAFAPMFLNHVLRGSRPSSLLACCYALLFAASLPLIWSHRIVIFDATRREVIVDDKGLFKRPKWVAPFEAVREISLVQREAAPIAGAPPMLVVNGRDLLTIAPLYANRNLELELRALVGLPQSESLRDNRGLSSF